MAALANGDRLGVFEIQGPVGAGGMGEVYRARDTRLGRLVAIKVLKAELSADAGRRQRFVREAESIAALSHPRVCALYDVGEHEGRLFLVMELIDGTALSTRIAAAPDGLPIGEALAIATQIAQALAFAHRHGVVHRDVKPANVMLTRHGVKLLDFGVARLAAADAGDVSSRSTLTGDGSPVGTLAYMAPEQIDGRADARSDLFAFGAVVYEMLTGRRAFAETTTSAVIAAIVQSDPPSLATIRTDASPAFRRAIERCLAKDPDRRWQSSTDLAEELAWVANGATATAVAPIPQARLSSPVRMLLAVATLAAAAVAVGLSGRGGAEATLTHVTHLEFELPPGTAHPAFGAGVALSPDGGTVVYSAGDGVEASATRALFVRRLDSPAVRRLADTDEGTYPFFAPDGTHVGFFADGVLKQVDLRSGAVAVLARFEPRAAGAAATWQPDGTILMGEHGDRPVLGLRRVAASTGAVEVLTHPDLEKREQTHFGPQPLPGTDVLLYTVRTVGAAGPEFRVVWQRGRAPAEVLVPGASLARLLPDDRLVYQVNDELFVATLDRGPMAVRSPRRILRGVAATASGPAWAVAGDTLVYRPQVANRRQLVWVDREGHSAPVGLPADEYVNPSLSPDGKSLAILVASLGRQALWLADLDRLTLGPITAEPQAATGVWMPGGRALLGSRVNGLGLDIVAYSLDGAVPPRLLLQDGGRNYPAAVTADGKTTVIMKGGAGVADLFSVAAAGPPRVLVASPAQEWGGRLSPDGRWMAYVSNVTGRFELYVTAFPVGGRQWQISRSGAREAVWSRDGRELFFRNGNAVLSVAITARAAFDWAPARVLFERAAFMQGGPGNVQYDVAPDGSRFLMIDTAPTETPAIRVIEGWSSLLD